MGKLWRYQIEHLGVGGIVVAENVISAMNKIAEKYGSVEITVWDWSKDSNCDQEHPDIMEVQEYGSDQD